MSSLPIDSLESRYRTQLQQDHLVVEAETGSGKSTRLPLWSAGYGRVLVIEPRRIACTSLAGYLAAQRNEPTGAAIDYAIKLENCFDEQSRVVFVTPGVALRWLAEDGLNGFDVVIVDEFHERRWDTDLLVAILKLKQQHRLVITSATIDGERLATYIGGVRLQAGGRQFEVAVSYRARDSAQLPDSRHLTGNVVSSVREVMEQVQGDVLVFLPGRKEISQCRQALESLEDVLIVPLHASVTDTEREMALTSQLQRKVVLATNVAETSLTIPNIEAVVDSGLERRTGQRNGRTTLSLKAISRASMRQRSGRAGRVRDGLCVRLYGKYAALETITPPELQREELVEAMLAAASCGYRLDELPFLESLPEKPMLAARQRLLNIGAIDLQGLITSHGRQIAPLPIDALYGDLVAGVRPRALQEAMIDLTAMIAVPGHVCQFSGTEEQAEQLNREEPLSCDAQLMIQVLRGKSYSGICVDPDLLREARGLSEQMRTIFELPQLEVASRYRHEELAGEIARIHPELLFVRREKRREALGNGDMEVLIGRNSRFGGQQEAALVLDHHSIPGRGVKQTLTLASVLMPVSLALIERLDLGQWQTGETSEVEGKLLTTHNLLYAGRTVATRQMEASGVMAIEPMVEAVKAKLLLPGLARERSEEIALWRLYVELGHDDHTLDHQNLTFDCWFAGVLTELGVSDMEELALFSKDDFPFDGIPYWKADEYRELYPFELNLGDLQLSVEYQLSKKRVYVIYQAGLRKGDPKRWELPRWSGLKIQYKKASRIVDVR